jgi:hypothetical protein
MRKHINIVGEIIKGSGIPAKYYNIIGSIR